MEIHIELFIGIMATGKVHGYIPRRSKVFEAEKASEEDIELANIVALFDPHHLECCGTYKMREIIEMLLKDRQYQLDELSFIRQELDGVLDMIGKVR
jgi:hypothetical protein